MEKVDVIAAYRRILNGGSYGPPTYRLFIFSYDRKTLPANLGSDLIFVSGPEEKLKVVLTHQELNELERLSK